MSSSQSLHYVATITNGQVKISNRRGFDEDMRAFEGKRILIAVKQYRKQRSNKQNAYYHGVVIPSVQQGLMDMGFEPRIITSESVHEMLKAKFLSKDVPVETGEFVTFVKSTADLSTTEMMEYIEDIARWSAEFLSIVIPEPG